MGWFIMGFVLLIFFIILVVIEMADNCVYDIYDCYWRDYSS